MPYELINNKRFSIAHLRSFGCKCFVLNNGKDDLGKFDAIIDEGVFVGYSSISKSYTIFNKRTLCMEESVHVKFDEFEIKGENIEDHEFKELIKDKEEVQGNEKKNAELSEGPGPPTYHKLLGLNFM